MSFPLFFPLLLFLFLKILLHLSHLLLQLSDLVNISLVCFLKLNFIFSLSLVYFLKLNLLFFLSLEPISCGVPFWRLWSQLNDKVQRAVFVFFFCFCLSKVWRGLYPALSINCRAIYKVLHIFSWCTLEPHQRPSLDFHPLLTSHQIPKLQHSR